MIPINGRVAFVGGVVMAGMLNQTGQAGLTILQLDRTLTAQVNSSGPNGGNIPPVPGPWTFGATQDAGVVRATVSQTLNASTTEISYSSMCETFYASPDFYRVSAVARSLYQVIFRVDEPTDWTITESLAGFGNLTSAGFSLATDPEGQPLPRIGISGTYSGTLSPGQYVFAGQMSIESGLAGRNNGEWSIDVVFTVPSSAGASILGIGLIGSQLRRCRPRR